MAAPYLERVIAKYEQSGIPLGVAEAELELALALRDQGAPNASTHADRARQIFGSHNLLLRVQEVTRLMDES